MWSSPDGVTWSLVAELTSLGPQSLNELAFDSQNYLYMFGGQTNPPAYTLVYFGARSTTPLTATIAPTSAAPPAADSALPLALLPLLLSLAVLAL